MMIKESIIKHYMNPKKFQKKELTVIMKTKKVIDENNLSNNIYKVSLKLETAVDSVIKTVFNVLKNKFFPFQSCVFMLK